MTILIKFIDTYRKTFTTDIRLCIEDSSFFFGHQQFFWLYKLHEVYHICKTTSKDPTDVSYGNWVLQTIFYSPLFKRIINYNSTKFLNVFRFRASQKRIDG